MSTWEHAARFPRAMESWEITELTPQETQMMELEKKKSLGFYGSLM